MRAVVCREFGPHDLLRIEDWPEPEPGPGEVQVAVAAVGVNYVDMLMCAGGYQLKPELPFVPGLEAAGTVRKLGPDVTGVAVGDRVISAHRPGAFAEYAVCGADKLWPVPEGFDFAEAATFRSAFHTAYHALAQRAHLKAGETLLVHGASGGTGLAAVQIGKVMGARVIATGGSDDKLAEVARLGADDVVNYTKGPLRDAVKALTGGKGVDVVFDPVGGDVFDESMRCLRWGARVCVIGFTSGRRPEAKVNHVLIKGASILGIRAGEATRHDPSLLEDSRRTLLGWVAEGKLRPHISHRFTLDQVHEALQTVADRKVLGKAVMTVG
ncbi:NADPH2:quinone reductase [Constrictibacter sp. MBR-5]|jgi:NADPH2:quinone reductase|uniref:NADPH:quinone oxidoreductase family protein n=1 Tax=Constrictibacter sp. MBR-5 TaxID=3156467 RepID=UPI0033998079